MVLPITSFSPGVQQMGAKDIDDPMAFVNYALLRVPNVTQLV